MTRNLSIHGFRIHTTTEPVYSWFQNPYNDRTRRSAMKAQLKERIEADMQELAALDALEL